MRVYVIQPRDIVIRAALRAGVEIVPILPPHSERPIVPALQADVLDPVAVAAAIRAHGRRAGPDVSLCVGPTDPTCLVAAAVNRLLEFRVGGFFVEEPLNRMSNKVSTRESVQASQPHLNPGWILARTPDEVTEFHHAWGSVVWKPLAGHGSRGVRVLSRTDPSPTLDVDGAEYPAIVEEKVEGVEYSVEGMSHRGVHHILAITEKTTGGRSGVVEVLHRQPAPLVQDLQRSIETATTHTLTAVGYTDGLSHTEVIARKDGSVKLIETHGRAGGDLIVDMLRWTIGHDGYDILFQTLAAGAVPEVALTGIEARVQFPDLRNTPLSMGEVGRALYARPAVKEVRFLQPPETWGPLDDSGDRHCLVLAAGLPAELAEVSAVMATLESGIDRLE